MPLVHEEVSLVVSFSQVHGRSEPPLHVVLPLTFVPEQHQKHVTKPNSGPVKHSRGRDS